MGSSNLLPHTSAAGLARFFAAIAIAWFLRDSCLTSYHAEAPGPTETSQGTPAQPMPTLASALAKLAHRSSQQGITAAAKMSFVRVDAKSLFVSEPNPAWFGNGANEPNSKHWTNANWLKSRFHFSFAEYNDPDRYEAINGETLGEARLSREVFSGFFLFYFVLGREGFEK